MSRFGDFIKYLWGTVLYEAGPGLSGCHGSQQHRLVSDVTEAGWQRVSCPAVRPEPGFNWELSGVKLSALGDIGNA